MWNTGFLVAMFLIERIVYDSKKLQLASLLFFFPFSCSSTDMRDSADGWNDVNESVKTSKKKLYKPSEINETKAQSKLKITLIWLLYSL